MFWLIWKQQRKQFLLGLLLVAAYAAFVLTTGISIDHRRQPDLISTTWLNIVRAGYAVPVLLGMFWGAPLISNEYDSGTNKFIWTQGISRRKWLFSKLAVTMIVAGLCGLACSLLASWWFGLPTSYGVIGSRFYPAQFGATGLMPIIYSIFAIGLGAAIGAWLKKPVAAIATTLALYSFAFFLVAGYLRPNYMTAYRYIYKAPTGCVTNHYPNGSSSVDCAHYDEGPASLRNDMGLWVTRTTLNMRQQTATGPQQTVFYQPGRRYWRFQGTEAGIYLGLSALTAVAAYRLVVKRDA